MMVDLIYVEDPKKDRTGEMFRKLCIAVSAPGKKSFFSHFPSLFFLNLIPRTPETDRSDGRTCWGVSIKQAHVLPYHRLVVLSLMALQSLSGRQHNWPSVVEMLVVGCRRRATVLWTEDNQLAKVLGWNSGSGQEPIYLYKYTPSEKFANSLVSLCLCGDEVLLLN